MAHLERLGPSSHVLTLKDGTRILFSYGTPVAAHVPGKCADCHAPDSAHCEGFPCDRFKGTGLGYVKSSVFHSRTTSGHVSRFLNGQTARAVDQAVLDSLVENV